MDIRDAIRRMSDQPLSHQVVMSLLKDYSNPNDKIHGLLTAGVLQQVRRGLYVAGPKIDGPRPEPALIANHIMGPSYVSLDSALSFYGLIPERVFAVTSVTTRASIKYDTPAGIFTYRRMPLPYYAFGITEQVLTEKQHVLMASAQKALLDKIVGTSGVTIRSRRQAQELLLENWRIDEDGLKRLDWTAAQTWLSDAPKADSLQYTLDLIASL